VNLQGLGSAFKQALRSIILVLLPLAFISLIVWATAGSSQGSTSDPIFAAMWIWIASHQVPLTIMGSMEGMKLSLLPLGALLFIFFAIRSGFSRLITTNVTPRQAAPLFAICYGILATLVGLISSIRNETIQAHWYLILPITSLIALAFSIVAGRLMPKRERQSWEFSAAWAAAVLGLMIALSALLFIGSLIFHYKAVFDLTTVIGPGIFGGLALILLQLLYFPNALVATLGYISGSGAEIGDGTIIHPFILELDQLPALPILGALPRGVFPYAIVGAVLVVVAGFLAHRKLRERFGGDREPLLALGFFLLFTTLLAEISSGQLISDALSSVGVSWWRFPLVITGELALGMAISRGILWWRQRSEKAKEIEQKNQG
jgi:hypothetical protein